MPKQSLLRFIKRWKRYQPQTARNDVPGKTRGLYVLYKQEGKHHLAVYIGVAGLGDVGGGGIKGRLRTHYKRMKKKWSHFSFFEVHDNVTREEIREFEALLLGIFRHDPRVKLANKQKGSRKLLQLQKTLQWKPS